MKRRAFLGGTLSGVIIGSGKVQSAARKDQAAGQDALERTIAQLKQALPADGTK